LALSNLLGIVKPFGTIRNSGNLTQVSRQVLEFATENGASEIIIGIPLDSDGILSQSVRNFNGNLCLNFSAVLSSIVIHERGSHLRTILFDERYTSKEARARILSSKIKGRSRYI
jgi:RNase H-fold protein (predicted Holliday junction resolvase)